MVTVNFILKKIPSLILFLWSLFCLLAAGIHLFLPDGGSASVAGLKTDSTLIGIFAWAGATQLVWSLLMLLVAVKYKQLISLILGLVVIERIIISVNAWYIKPPIATNNLPPEVYITLYCLPFLILGLVLSFKNN